jgi:hypothetical protein
MMFIVRVDDSCLPSRRWYTGGGQGGSGQEVIAPGRSSNMAKDFMDSVKPHGRQGTSEDLEAKKGAFSGSARTLDGALPELAAAAPSISTTVVHACGSANFARLQKVEIMCCCVVIV